MTVRSCQAVPSSSLLHSSSRFHSTQRTCRANDRSKPGLNHDSKAMVYAPEPGGYRSCSDSLFTQCRSDVVVGVAGANRLRSALCRASLSASRISKKHRPQRKDWSHCTYPLCYVIGLVSLEADGRDLGVHRSSTAPRRCCSSVPWAHINVTERLDDFISARGLPPSARERMSATAKCSVQDTLSTTTTTTTTVEDGGTVAVGGEIYPDEVSEWEMFSGKASGEWDGYSAEFLANGDAIELPESVVPQAFRDWEVRVCDWQTQCPTLATPDRRVILKTIRLLPTVGCEADAATRYSVAEKQMCAVEEGVVDRSGLFAFKGDGSFVASWHGGEEARQSQSQSESELRPEGSSASELTLPREWIVEHCLVDDGDERVRVRVLQSLERSSDTGLESVRVKRITVFREKYEGPWQNGESYGGCGTGLGALAEMPRVQRSALDGSWTVGERWGYDLRCKAHDEGRKTISSGIVPLKRGEGPVEFNLGESSLQNEDPRQTNGVCVRLPAGVWSRVSISNRPGARAALVAEAGWVVEKGRMVMSVCEYESSGEVETVCIVSSTRVDESRAE